MLPPPADLDTAENDGFAFDSEFDDDGNIVRLHDTSFWGFASDEDAADDERIDYYEEQMLGRPWSSDDLPFLAEWFNDNRPVIDRVVEGLERPEWGLPAAGLIRGSGAPYDWLSPGMSQAREATRVLRARALFHAGEEDWGAARRDAVANLRLAAHVAKGPFLIDQLIAAAVGGIGMEALQRVALTPDVPPAVLRGLFEDLGSLGPATNMTATFSRGERLYGLASIVEYYSANDLSEFGGDQLGYTAIDWNVALRRINALHDRAAKAGANNDFGARRAELDALDGEIEASADRLDPGVAKVRRMLTPAGRGEVGADLLCANTLMSFRQMSKVEERTRSTRALTRLAIALAIHCAEQGAYPEFLDELVPGVLDKLPVDLFHQQPYVYRRTDDGFLLYSCGPNGIDDGGSNEGSEGDGDGPKRFEGIEIDAMLTADPDRLSPEEERAYELIDQIPAGADDYSIRVPLPVEPWPWERATSDAEAGAPAPPK